RPEADWRVYQGRSRLSGKLCKKSFPFVSSQRGAARPTRSGERSDCPSISAIWQHDAVGHLFGILQLQWPLYRSVKGVFPRLDLRNELYRFEDAGDLDLRRLVPLPIQSQGELRPDRF